MARVLVTGSAGFIGSTLAERLVHDGHDVVGVDCLSPYYDVSLKRKNLARLAEQPQFRFVEQDLAAGGLDALVADADCVFHLAGAPGVTTSWGEAFGNYVRDNLVATRLLLDAIVRTSRARVVFASSSSVYGNAQDYPVTEAAVTRPYSPYGVTKMAAEALCGAYSENFGVDIVMLRYFTVYGPRQRPDMGMHRLINAAVRRETFTLYGTGTQVRDFTFVDDVVAATVAAATADVAPRSVFNVCGGIEASVNEIIDEVQRRVEAEVRIVRAPQRPGDLERTGGSNKLASECLGWAPEVTLRDGIAMQVAWQTTMRDDPAP